MFGLFINSKGDLLFKIIDKTGRKLNRISRTIISKVCLHDKEAGQLSSIKLFQDPLGANIDEQPLPIGPVTSFQHYKGDGEYCDQEFAQGMQITLFGECLNYFCPWWCRTKS